MNAFEVNSRCRIEVFEMTSYLIKQGIRLKSFDARLRKSKRVFANIIKSKLKQNWLLVGLVEGIHFSNGLA